MNENKGPEESQLMRDALDQATCQQRSLVATQRNLKRHIQAPERSAAALAKARAADRPQGWCSARVWLSTELSRRKAAGSGQFVGLAGFSWNA
jgi:hypothetical protein